MHEESQSPLQLQIIDFFQQTWKQHCTNVYTFYKLSEYYKMPHYTRTLNTLKKHFT